MTEYYIEANSFAAPFFSDQSHGYVEAETPASALDKFAADYKHPAGLYAAVAYTSADASNKGESPLARWLCNQAQELETTYKDGSSFRQDAVGKFEIDGRAVVIENPKAGSVVSAQAIEAQRAETGTGSVHESAVPEGDAPHVR